MTEPPPQENNLDVPPGDNPEVDAPSEAIGENNVSQQENGQELNVTTENVENDEEDKVEVVSQDNETNQKDETLKVVTEPVVKPRRKFSVRSPRKKDEDIDKTNRRKFVVVRSARKGEQVNTNQTSPSKGIRRNKNSGEVVSHTILGKPKHFENSIRLQNGDEDTTSVDILVSSIRNRAVGVNLMKNRLTKARSALKEDDPLVLLKREHKSRSRRLSSLKKIADESNEKEQKNHQRKLANMLPHHRLAHDRESRTLQMWKERQKDWTKWKGDTAKRVGKDVADLVVSRAEDYREMLEEYALVHKSMPTAEKQGSDFWMMSLRGDGTRYVPVGNIFSGLFCPIKDDNANVPIIIRRPGMKQSSASWRDSHQLQRRKRQVAKKMQTLRPHAVEQSHADGLIVSGCNLFDWALNSTSTFYENAAVEQASTRESSLYVDLDGDGIDDVTGETIPSDYLEGPQLCLRIIGENGKVCSQHSTSDPKSLLNIILETTINESVVSNIQVENTGSCALYYEWGKDYENNAESNLIPNEQEHVFSCAMRKGVILPGQTQDTAIVFATTKAGIFRDSWKFITNPNANSLSKVKFSFTGIAKDIDKSEIHKRLGEVVNKRISQSSSNQMDDSLLSRVQTPKSLDIVGSEKSILHRDIFEAHNPGLHYLPRYYAKFEAYALKLFSILRVQRKHAEWDGSVDTLRDLLNTLEKNKKIDAAYIEMMRSDVETLVLCASKRPADLPSFYPMKQKIAEIDDTDVAEDGVEDEEEDEDDVEDEAEAEDDAEGKADDAVEGEADDVEVKDEDNVESGENEEKEAECEVDGEDAVASENDKNDENQNTDAITPNITDEIQQKQFSPEVTIVSHGSILKKRTIHQLTPDEVNGKNVLIRTDLNVKFEDDDGIAPEAQGKISRACRSVKTALSLGAARVLLLTHLDHLGKAVSAACLKDPLEDELEDDVTFISNSEDIVSSLVDDDEGAIYLLENIQFRPEDWRLSPEAVHGRPGQDENLALQDVAGTYSAVDSSEEDGNWSIFSYGLAISPSGEKTKVRRASRDQLVLDGGGGVLKLTLGRRNVVTSFRWSSNDVVYEHTSKTPAAIKLKHPSYIVEPEEGEPILLDEDSLPPIPTLKEAKLLEEELSSICDVFINDALSICGGTSISSVIQPQSKGPCVAGHSMVLELKHVAALLEKPRAPLVVVAGGEATQQRVHMVRGLLASASHVLFGGQFGLALLLAQNSSNDGCIGATKVDHSKSHIAMKHLLLDARRRGVRLLLPTDFVTGDVETKSSKEAIVYEGDTDEVSFSDIDENSFILDIGPNTTELYTSIIQSAECVVIVGGLGELQYDDAGRCGTTAILDAVSTLTAAGKPTLVAGWDMVNFVIDTGLEESLSCVSDAGSAMIKLLSGQSLPGLTAIPEILEGEESNAFDFATSAQDGIDVGDEIGVETQEEENNVNEGEDNDNGKENNVNEEEENVDVKE